MKPTNDDLETVKHFKAFRLKQPIHSAQVFMIAYGKEAVMLSNLYERHPKLFEQMLEEYATVGGWEADGE